jgi:hypothetical protein
MANLLVTAFNGGELSPYMDARTDVAKYRSGCRLLENMVVLPYGGVYRRSGTEYLGEAKLSDKRCRLIPFNFSTTTRFVLEFGHLYLRVWGNNSPVESGGSPLELVTPYTEDDLRELQYAQLNDIMYLAHGSHAPRKLSRVADDNWTLATVAFDFPPLRDMNVTATTIAASASFGTATLTASDDTFESGHVGSQWAIQWPRNSGSIDETISGNKVSEGTLDIQGSWTITTVGTWLGRIRLLRVPREKINANGGRDLTSLARSTTTATATRPAHGYATGDEVFIASTVAAPFAGTYTITVTGDDTYTFTVANSGAASASNAPVQNLSKMEVVREFSSLTTARNFTATGTEDERVGLKLRVTDYVSNTSARVFLESTDFNSGGTFTIDSVASATSAGATVNQWLGSVTTGTTQWSEAAFSAVRGYPRTVTFHEQRLCFGGTVSQPNTIWCSKVDDFENFQLGSAENDGLSFTIASNEGNRINWVFSQKQLIVGTSGDEWTVGGATDTEPFSATNISARRQASYGSKYMRAVLLNDVLLFVQRRGRKVRELVYKFEQDGWVAPDLTVLSEHITEGEIVELAFQQQPDAVLWAVRGDGKLIGMSYERDQEVVAWHRHTTDGQFESAATVYGLDGDDDEVWFAVRRTINGQTKRYIERFKPDFRNSFETEAKDNWWYLDCAARYEGAPAQVITGLSYLEGKTVGVLADGAVQPSKTVVSGEITLDKPASKVLVGLPFTSTLQPMKLDYDMQDGPTRGRKKRLNRVEVSLYKSLGGEASTDGQEWLWMYPRDFDDPMDASPPPFSGDTEVVLAGNYSEDADLYLRQTLPYPLTVRALVAKLDAFGD